MKTLLSTLAAVTLLCSVPVAWAEDSSAGAAASSDDAEMVRMAKEHYKLGLEAYKAGKLEVAIKELKRAYLIKKIPALLLNLGATYRKMGDLEAARAQYKKYLDEAPAGAKDRADVEKIVAELSPPSAPKAVPVVVPPPVKESEKVAEARVDVPWHIVVDSAPPDWPIDVLASNLPKGAKASLFYRRPGEAEFSKIAMKPRGSDKVGRIPARATAGKSLQYYVEARSASGQVLNASGSQMDPNVIVVDPDARPVIYAAYRGKAPTDTREEPEEKEEGKSDTKSSQARLDDESAPVAGVVATSKAPRPTSRFSTLFWSGVAVAAVGVGLGVGFGVAGAVQSKRYSDFVSADSLGDQNGVPYRFNDPAAPNGQDDASFEQSGQFWSSLGLGMAIGGGVMAVGGVTMILVDRLVLHKGERKSAWYVVPAASSSFAGAGAGFSF